MIVTGALNRLRRNGASSGRVTSDHRILFLTSSASYYGSERALIELIVELRRLGAMVSVIVPCDGQLRQELLSLGVAVIVQPLQVICRAASLWDALRFLRAAVLPSQELLLSAQRFAPTVVYSNTSHIVDGPTIARRLSVPHVWHLREIERSSPIIRRAFGLWLLASGSSVFAISQSVREAYYGKWFRRPTVVHDGIDLARYSSGKRYVAPKEFSDARPLRVLCAARITRWKGQHIVASAIEKLCESGYPVVLRIVGDALSAADEAYLAELRERAATSRGSIMIEGGVGDIRPLLSWCDVLAHMSTAPEPFGRSVVEALAFPRAVIASAAGGPIEVLGERAGILVPPANANAVVSEIVRLLAHPALLEDYCTRGAVRAREFSVSATAAKVHNVLSGLSHG